MSAYISEADATAYLLGEMNSEPWTDSTIAEREKALITAQRAMDRLAYTGDKTVDTQTEEFPRDDAIVVPIQIGYANALEALALLDGKDPEVEFENVFQISQGFANIRSTANTNMGSSNIINGIMSSRAWKELQPFLADPHDLILERVN